MNPQEHIEKMAVTLGNTIGNPDSPALRKVLKRAMSDDEARFLLDLPAPKDELAAKYGLGDDEIEAKLLDLARRGLVISSRKGPRMPGELATLHDSIMSSAPSYIPEGIDALWRELYDDEDWGSTLGDFLGGFPVAPIRSIPVIGSVSEETKLATHEDIEAIIRANADMISIRECCCRNAAKKCDHPNDVCMQFGRRAQYDLYRGSGRKVSAEEAIEIARRAGDSGLVPTVTNMSNLKAMEFICFCCGCCCLVINPGLRTGKLDKIMVPSRFLAQINDCDGCALCIDHCSVDAISMQAVEGWKTEIAVIDPVKCVGCGACVTSCPTEGFITMAEVRPPEFIPEKYIGPSVLGAEAPVAPMGVGADDAA